MTDRRGLVLVPCCKEKASIHGAAIGHPLDGIAPAREGLVARLRATPDLAELPENRDGILAQGAGTAPAAGLYNGAFYRPLRGLWGTSNVDLLIVSAAYGVVHPFEPIRRYELQMGSRLADGSSVYRYWRDAGLGRVLASHAERRGVTHVWSLLPDSMASGTPYQQSLVDFWDHCRERKITATHVKVFNSEGASAGTGTAAKRGQWLAAILRSNPSILTEPNPPSSLSAVSGFSFGYESCGWTP